MIYTIERIIEITTPIFQSYNINHATLFGSVAKGTNDEHSDIDILVDSGLKGLQFFGLLEALCNAFECDVDLIDTQDLVAGSEPENEIKRTGIVIFEKR